MRDIEGIENVIRILQPYWDQIETHFNNENARFKALLARDHDELGRVLKCHLIVENYLDRYLARTFGLVNLDAARLTFAQKAKLLPNSGSTASFVKPGILKLNSIRNKFGHNLKEELSVNDLGAINDVLDVARQGIVFSNAVERIEAFTTICCTWLVVPPTQLEHVFLDAFAHIHVNIS